MPQQGNESIYLALQLPPVFVPGSAVDVIQIFTTEVLVSGRSIRRSEVDFVGFKILHLIRASNMSNLSWIHHDALSDRWHGLISDRMMNWWSSDVHGVHSKHNARRLIDVLARFDSCDHSPNGAPQSAFVITWHPIYSFECLSNNDCEKLSFATRLYFTLLTSIIIFLILIILFIRIKAHIKRWYLKIIIVTVCFRIDSFCRCSG